MGLKGILEGIKRTKKFSFGKHDLYIFEPKTLREATEFMEEKNKEGCSCRMDQLKGDNIVVCHCSCYKEKSDKF